MLFRTLLLVKSIKRVRSLPILSSSLGMPLYVSTTVYSSETACLSACQQEPKQKQKQKKKKVKIF